MKKKWILLIICTILAIIIGVGVYMSNKNNNAAIENDPESLRAKPLADKLTYNGNKKVFFENTSDKEVEKISISEYGSDENQVTATYEINKEELSVDENNILTVKIPDKNDVKYRISIVTNNNEEYKMDKLIGTELVPDRDVIPFKLDESSNTIILLEEVDEGEYVELEY